MGVHIRKIHL